MDAAAVIVRAAMQLDAIQLFCDIASEGSISGGARLHGVTQSAASQRLMALERELGTRLIDRGTRPIRLTAAGEAYRHGCADILRRYEALKRQISAPAGAISGVVKVAAIYSAGIDLLSRAEERFRAEHPRVKVRVEYLQPGRVHERVRDQRVDFGVISYPSKWRDVAAQPLRDEIMSVVCRADHPLAQREVLDPVSLLDQSLVGFDASLPIAGQISGYLRRNGGQPRLSHTFDNIDTIKAYLGHSDEAAILPFRAVRWEVEDGLLAGIRLEPRLTRPVAVVTPLQRSPSAAAAALIEALIADDTANPEPEPAAPAVPT